MDFLPVAKTEKKEESIFDTIKTVVVVVLVVLVVRTFAFEPFNIPSGSMIPTLLVGDYVVVSKYSYGYSKYSFPFYNPPITGRIFGKLPERGDVAVFRLPRDPSIDYIKRIIGLPGDRIQVRDSILYINDKAVARRRIDDFVDDEYGRPVPTYQFIETLPNGRQHPILQRTLDGSGENDNTTVFTVPDGYFFAMGDNRNNSEDSRIPSAVGYVPMENLIGRAEFRFFSIDAQAPWWQFWKWPSEIRFSRMFTGIH